jgi:tungstate transport system substrate-binding protein
MVRRHRPAKVAGGPRGWISALCTLAIAAGLGCAGPVTQPLEIATTTSVQNSGLLDVLLPAYLGESGVEVRVHAAGSGRALQMLSEGLVQLVISHAPDAEARALSAHPEWISRRLAHNWFVVVGPANDPAAVGSATDAAEAFRRIAASLAPFVSRGDQSGTHEREIALWEAAGSRPPPGRYVSSGRGMSLALRHADELQGYTLSDEATFLQLAPELDLEILFRGDPRFLNVYSVIHPRDGAAEQFAGWLIEGRGRDLIAGFTVDGQRVFAVEPAAH